ncbi:MAG: Dipeptide and tripeptide permease A, partial [Chlamydiae bacterium]|nr:Dipeptide and tripeptide permease A [Chlamydiota bacterium]
MKQQDVIFSNKHPKAMYLLALIEICQRFAFWGVAYLLVLYLVNHFSYSTPKATHIYGIYMGIAFTLPILGGYIADKWNYRSPILLGSILTSTGCFLLASLNEMMLFPSLLLIGLGAGLFTPSIYSLLGSIYAKKQHIREGGFSIYYSSVSLGVLLAMIILGYLQTFNWRLVFLVSGSVQLLGVILYFFIVPKLKHLDIPPHYFISKKDDPNHFPLKRHEIHRIIVILIMTLVSIVFWIAYSQAGSSMTLFALKFTDRSIAGFEVPVPWFTASEMFFLILFAFPLARLYLSLKRLKSSASPPMKTALSLFFMGLCFLVMQRAVIHIPLGATSANISHWYLISSFALMSLAELLIAPIGLSLVTNLSPHRYRGFLTGVWFACIGIGYYLGGYVAGFMDSFSLTTFFDIFVIISFIP